MFTVPAVLGALIVLPALYLLLRVTPPRPRQVPFPPFRLLRDETPVEETPARTPPWLLALRLLVAALIILAVAGPIWNPPPTTLGSGAGPLLVVLDDGLAAAPDWDMRIAAAAERLAEAGRKGRSAAVVPMSEGARAIAPTTAAEALDRLRALKPVPFVPDRTVAAPAVSGFLDAHPDTDVVWIADGLESGAARAFAERLAGAAHRPSVLVPGATPVMLAGAANAPDKLDVRVIRADIHAAARGTARAYDMKNLALGDAGFDFGAGTETAASFTLPVELRNAITRVAVLGDASAGAVTLLDGRWKRRRVDIVSGATADVAQPLLSPDYFLTRALAPYADVREVRPNAADPISLALDEHPSVLVLADVGTIPADAHDKLARFVDAGGLLLRFAGSRLAGAPSDDLEPVTLRRGGRTFGGSMSWDKPQTLAPFDRASPFFGLSPPEDATVTRQVLAEPDANLPGKSWAQLADGTPLVTADKRGKGTIVLFHVTADTTWSNLPLSGLFVDMLRRVVALSGEAASDQTKANAPAGAGSLTPNRTLDGFGALGSPPAAAKPIATGFDGPASLDHPPGFYGPPDAGVAVNAFAPDTKLSPASWDGLALTATPLAAARPVDLRATLLTLVLIGFIVDGLATILMGGRLRRPWRRAVVAAAAALALAFAATLVPSAPTRAQDAPSLRDMASALTTRLAYVATGDAVVDEESRQGLQGLSRALADRTSLSPGDPVAVDPARDELAFYPLLYWPVVATAPQPTPDGVARAAAFMRNGGTVVFDTRDALTASPGGPPSAQARWLRQVLAGVDVPELEPVPRDHVITKTFYLIDGFVGRYNTGQTWIEALPPAPPGEVNRPARAGDSVSPILITGNDLAAGWASDAQGDPLYPLVPGGARQRELSIRGGVNLVIYTLTGNYKADQVHVHDLLERLAH